MRARIHRGASEDAGNCVEVNSQRGDDRRGVGEASSWSVESREPPS